MRTFTLGTAADDRTIVTIERQGSLLLISQMKPDGTARRGRKEFATEDEARAEVDRMAAEMTADGYLERRPAGSKSSRPAATRPKAPDENLLSALANGDDVEADAASSPVLARRGGPATTDVAAPKPKTKKKKKAKGKGKTASEDGLDKRVIAAVVAFGLALVCGIGYVAYDALLKPPTIVGTWAGSMLDFEIGKPMVHTQYRLVLDDKKRAALTLQEKFTSTGTYAVKGDHLSLVLKDEGSTGSSDDAVAGDDGNDNEPATPAERQYRFVLHRSTLDLFDPGSGKKVVQLIRFREPPVVGGGGVKPPETPKTVAAGEIDKDADARLASVEFAPTDGAFRLKHPPGWASKTGSRPDNSYSWVKLTKGSAKIEVYADVQGSLISGSDSAQQHEEGSELAPVHVAHEAYRRTASEEFSDYKESAPSLFKGSGLGEGRIASFTASGGLFGSKLRGYRVTLLTKNRRVSILCSCPSADFKAMEPTFLAVCRSVSY